MATSKQITGDKGEKLVTKTCSCPKCKKKRTLRLLPTNFKCADIICDFCGYLAQVKTLNVKNIAELPDTILGAAWGPQYDRMLAGIYFPLYVVLLEKKAAAIYYLSADLQESNLFVPRTPLSKDAKRAGWQGFTYNLKEIKDRFVRLL